MHRMFSKALVFLALIVALTLLVSLASRSPKSGPPPGATPTGAGSQVPPFRPRPLAVQTPEPVKGRAVAEAATLWFLLGVADR